MFKNDDLSYLFWLAQRDTSWSYLARSFQDSICFSVHLHAPLTSKHFANTIHSWIAYILVLKTKTDLNFMKFEIQFFWQQFLNHFLICNNKVTSKPITWYLWNATQLDILWAEILQNSPVLIHWQWWFGSVLFKSLSFSNLASCFFGNMIPWEKNPELSVKCHTFYGECNFQALLIFINFIWSHSHKTTFQQRRWNSGFTGYTLTSQVMVMDGVGACLHPHSLESPIGPPVYQGDDGDDTFFIFMFCKILVKR